MHRLITLVGLLLTAGAVAAPDPVAMILATRGDVTVIAMEGDAHRAAAMDLLRAGDHVLTGPTGEATLVFLNDRHRERTRSGNRVTIRLNGGAPGAAVVRLPPARPGVIVTARGVRELARGGRGAAVVARGDPNVLVARDPALPAPPPAVRPMFGAAVLSDRPAFSWQAPGGAGPFTVSVYEAPDRLLWSLSTPQARLDFPPGYPPLMRGTPYWWSVAAADGGLPPVASRFTVVTASVERELAGLASLRASTDPADLLLAAVTYQSHRAYDEALDLFERIARLTPDDGAIQAALADYYTRAGREEEAQSALRRARDLLRRPPAGEARVMPPAAAVTPDPTSPRVPVTRAGRRRALLVGISRYARAGPTPWPALSCTQDVTELREVLVERFGFRPADVLVLQDEQATRAGIVRAFDGHLIRDAGPGDIAVFHFSGHGQRVRDDDGDEWDGLDESLVPYDYVSQRAADGAQTNLRDDELGRLLRRLSDRMRGADGRVQGSIAVFLDSCHSGTATRGRLRARGRDWNTALDGPLPRPRPGKDPKTGSGFLRPADADGLEYAFLSACRNNQRAFEKEDAEGRPLGGAFTYHLVRALQTAGERTSYRDLFERVSVDVAGDFYNQNPELEGNGAQLLFSGLIRPAPALPVVRSTEGDSVILSVGRLHGATTGSRFALYRPSTSVDEPENRIAEVELDRVQLTMSRARLLPAYVDRVRPEDLRAARAVETAHRFDDERLRVRLVAAPELAGTLREFSALTTADVSAASYQVEVRRRNHQYDLLRADGSRLGRADTGPGGADRVRDLLLGEWRWQYLCRLRPEGETPIRVEMRVVPVRVRTDQAGTLLEVLGDVPVPRSRTNRSVFRDGDYVMIELRNPSELPAYVTVLDLSPDGTINPIFPHPARPGIADRRLPPDGQWRRLPFPLVFRLQAPFGQEVFKAIATREEVDFAPLLTRTGDTERGASSLSAIHTSARPLATLLRNAATGRTRGATHVEPGFWGVSHVTFEVRPR